MLRIWYLVQLSLVLNLGNFQLELKDVIRNSTLLKVSISKKQFFLKPYYPKKEQNIRQNLPHLKLDLRIYSGLLVYSVLFVGFSPFYQVGTETPHRY